MAEVPRCPRCSGRCFWDAAGDWSCLNCGWSPPVAIPQMVRDELARGRLRPAPRGRPRNPQAAEMIAATRLRSERRQRARRREAV